MRLFKAFIAVGLLACLSNPVFAQGPTAKKAFLVPVLLPPVFVPPVGANIAAPQEQFSKTPPLLPPSAGILSPAPTPQAMPAPQTGPRSIGDKIAAKSRRVQRGLEVGPIGKMTDDAAKGLGFEVVEALTNDVEDAAGAGASADSQSEPLDALREDMRTSLNYIYNVFLKNDAPLRKKEERFHIDIQGHYKEFYRAIVSNPNITVAEFQVRLRRFFAAVLNYHDSTMFYATGGARLPLTVIPMLVDGQYRYYVAFISPSAQQPELAALKVGDEIVEFNGRPVAAAIDELAAQAGGSSPDTNRLLAAIFLTNQRRARGDQLPASNEVSLKIRREAQGQPDQAFDIKTKWVITEEQYPSDVPPDDASSPKASGGLNQPQSGLDADNDAPESGMDAVLKLIKLAYSKVAHPHIAIFEQMVEGAHKSNPHMVGSPESMLPPLGKILWQGPPDNPFRPAIFETVDQRKIGFLRISSYSGSDKEVAEFKKIIVLFQKETDGLVIDQMNNPGGSVFYLYALASHLTDKPLITPKHQLKIGEPEYTWARQLLSRLQQMMTPPGGPQAPEKAAGENPQPQPQPKIVRRQPTADGYPITPEFMKGLFKYALFIVEQFADVKTRFTEPMALQGIDYIQPVDNAEERYTKPIVFLTNPLDFSGGDFMPAILQDNGRALIVSVAGEHTAGAGGVVHSLELLNSEGIAGFSYTASMAIRRLLDGSLKDTLEDWGVKGSIRYNPTPKDLKTGFAGLKEFILDTVKKQLPPPSEQPQAKAETPPASPTNTKGSGPTQAAAQPKSPKIPPQAWSFMVEQVAGKGRTLTSNNAASAIKMFRLPADSQIKAWHMPGFYEKSPDGTKRLHALYSYAYSSQGKSQVGHYIFSLGENGKAMFFLVGSEGQLIRSAKINFPNKFSSESRPEPEVVDAPLQSEFASSFGYWTALTEALRKNPS